ncbi:MAG TPA: cytochrome c3 family protein [Chthoniobacterales bacterium]|nr:cytochrome c3 family protein [Chthoniobacterales bacterium]
MATPGPTQKQIAERYKGHLSYFKKMHPWRVARWCASFLAIVGGIAAIFIFQKLVSQKRVSEEFFSSGELSSNHARYQQDCAQCHDKSASAGNDITAAKFQTTVSAQFHHGINFKKIDHRCQECHEIPPPVGNPKKYDFHEPNVVENRSCSICHQEHLGPGPMKRVADLHCASCHASGEVMKASAQYGAQLPPAAFHFRPHPAQQVVFEMPRPTRGYTEVFSSFSAARRSSSEVEHPEFQLVREHAKDLNSDEAFRFNHQLHFGSNFPLTEKLQKLDCTYCHKPDPEGRFYQRINFEANCQACHALLFDKNNPQLHVPHGDANLVRNFLRTLPAQYGDYARLSKGKIRDGDVQIFVAEQIRKLREQFHSGEQLEMAVFFEKHPYEPQRNADSKTRANFAGCAYCHEVKMPANSAPVITPPVLVDRWMPQARFNHAKHVSVNCEECHNVRNSSKTSDVLMPNKATCVACHSPETKKIASNCITCHAYHATPQVAAADVHADARGSFKQMLLGSNR